MFHWHQNHSAAFGSLPLCKYCMCKVVYTMFKFGMPKFNITSWGEISLRLLVLGIFFGGYSLRVTLGYNTKRCKLKNLEAIKSKLM